MPRKLKESRKQKPRAAQLKGTANKDYSAPVVKEDLHLDTYPAQALYDIHFDRAVFQMREVSFTSRKKGVPDELVEEEEQRIEQALQNLENEVSTSLNRYREKIRSITADGTNLPPIKYTAPKDYQPEYNGPQGRRIKDALLAIDEVIKYAHIFTFLGHITEKDQVKEEDYWRQPFENFTAVVFNASQGLGGYVNRMRRSENQGEEGAGATDRQTGGSEAGGEQATA